MSCRAAILLFPGINREREMFVALRSATFSDPFIIWHEETQIPPVDIIVIPGGFSHGDYLRPGAIAARSPVMDDVVRKAHQGVTVLGICNGFQILTERGLLAGSLMCNASLKFLCRDVYLRVEQSETRFTSRYQQGQVLKIPVANGSGRYVADSETLARLEGEGQILFRYCNAHGELDSSSNSGGSVSSIAGIINDSGNVLGMMPHPENSISSLTGGIDGLALFKSVVDTVPFIR